MVVRLCNGSVWDCVPVYCLVSVGCLQKLYCSLNHSGTLGTAYHHFKPKPMRLGLHWIQIWFDPVSLIPFHTLICRPC